LIIRQIEWAREAQTKLSEDTAIARAKLHEYLLRHRDEDDKSGFLALAGYTLNNADRLMHDIRTQPLPLDAEFFDRTEYGSKYRIRGTLTGPNGRVLRVLSIWMKEDAIGETRFVTPFPDNR
jgi:hypothetical protein